VAELLKAAKEMPGELAIDDGQGTCTWSEFNGRVNRWIRLFREHGLEVGDRLSLLIGNRRETFEALTACLHAGITVVPVNYHLMKSEVSYIIQDSGSRGLVTDAEHAQLGAEAVRDTGSELVLRVVTGDTPVAGFTALEPALAGMDDSEPDAQSSGALLLYTSGTTGRPKGVMNDMFQPGAPLARVVGLLNMLGSAFGIPERGRALLVGPWYHSAQIFFSLFPLLRQCQLVIHGRFDAAATLETIDRDHISLCHLVPTQFIRLLRVDPEVRKGFDGGSLQQIWHSGGACPVAVKTRMIEWWGPKFTEFYAASEGGVVATINSEDWLKKPGSVGRAAPGTQIVTVDENGKELPPDTEGVLYVRRTPDRDFFYHNAPEKTKSAYLAPGFFTFGDVGHVDREGFVYITGRSSDVVNSGGVNIYPAEVEAVLVEHPAVGDVAVFAVPDKEFGEQVKAAVVLADGAGATADELNAFARERLAGFKVPRSYDFVPALPRDPSGKLRKQFLRDQYWH
jgi:acyl-CoA synthetase (AMP-forming)/AMP-acid ligase II